MNTPEYLARINYKEPVRADFETLSKIQRAHLLSVPFENLDIGLGRPIQLSLIALWDKVVGRKRGGFCYELNGLLAWFLNEVGFEVTYLNACDYHVDDDTFGIDFDHLTLLVKIPNLPTRWLVDVGWGDTFTSPLDIDNLNEQAQGSRAYQLEPFRGGYQLWQRNTDGSRERQYFFDLIPHNFPSDYLGACNYHQTSPNSIFTKNRIISRLTQNGRISLDNNHLIITQKDVKTVSTVKDDEEFNQLLEEHFGVIL